MWSKFHTNNFFKKSSNIGKTLFELGDPLVGKKIIKLQQKSLLIRADGRGLGLLHQQNGLLPRIPEKQLEGVRQSQVERYQKFNDAPFAWGACSSLQDLLVFLKHNKSHAENCWIHKFYGKATPLIVLKYEVGIESEGLDKENETMIVEHIPFKQFIASTCPKFRDKFMNGGLVPNAMHDYNPYLPKSMRISDLLTEKSILTWLMINNSEQAFKEICLSLFQNMTSEALALRFPQEPDLLSAIQGVLGEKENSLRL